MSGLGKVHAERIESVLASLSERGLEALWVEPSVGLFYLTGLDPVSMERMFGLLLHTNGEARMVVPLLLRDESAHVDIAEHIVWDDSDGPEEAVSRALTGVKRLSVQGSLPFWSLEVLRGVAAIEIAGDEGVVAGLRERKSPEEVDLIRKSGALTDAMVDWVGTLDLNTLTERELASRIQARYLEQGVMPSPHGLVAAGANAAMPHYVGGDAPITTDAPLLMDIGCSLEGYWSDITRIYFPRDLDADTAEAYDLVCKAYDAAFAAVAPGVPCSEVDRAARSVIEKSGYGEAFFHRTGHGLGLEVHESPYIRSGNDEPLEAGHVFSIEPGIYVPGKFGVRYENIVHLGPDGPESMNQSPRLHHF